MAEHHHQSAVHLEIVCVCVCVCVCCVVMSSILYMYVLSEQRCVMCVTVFMWLELSLSDCLTPHCVFCVYLYVKECNLYYSVCVVQTCKSSAVVVLWLLVLSSTAVTTPTHCLNFCLMNSSD